MEQVQTKKSEEAIKVLFFDATELYSQTRWLITDTNDDISDSESDSDSSCADDAVDKVHELAQSVKVYTNCLIDLGTALECPALEPEYEDGPSVVMWEQRTAHDYHTDLIKAKFPQAKHCLLQSLGKISWNRYQRLQQERDSNAVAQSALIPGDKSLAAFSEFKDSGLGTSLPRVASSYAETIVSFMTSVSGGKGVNIPPLSTEAKNGQPFECNACGKHIRAINNREWR